MVLIYGSEAFLRETLLRELAGRVVAGGDPFGLAVVEGEAADPGQVAALAGTVTFFGAGRLVVVRDLPVLRSRGGTAGQAAPDGDADMAGESARQAGAGQAGAGQAAGGERDWVAVVRGVPEGACLCLYQRDDDVDGRSALVRAVAGRGKVYRCTPFGAADAAVWVRSQARRHQKTIHPDAVGALVAEAGTDLGRLGHELKKLVAYAGDARAIGPDDVAAVASSIGESSVFNLVDAVGQGEPAEALRHLRRLLDRAAEPLMLLFMLARQVRLIWGALALGATHRTDADLARALKVHPYVGSKARRQAARFTAERLEEALGVLLRTDLAIKTGRLEPELALELAVIELARAIRPLPRPAPRSPSPGRPCGIW